ncbi:MAG: hypothetical protein QXY52_02260 [Conexivisphaerales archaeon]
MLTISEKERSLGGSFVAHDFTIDSTFATVNAGRPALKGTDIAHIQNDSRKRKSLQKHNRQKKYVNDALLL